MKLQFRPKILSVIKKGYHWELFRQDFIAGMIISILALPMAISFAVSSGVRPEQGLITAIIGGFLIALFGGSMYQVSGPTGAFVILIFTILHKYGADGLLMTGIIAALVILMMGLFKVGKFIRFVPYPVTIGLTSGLALVIFVGQIPVFLGMQIEHFPSDFIHRVIICWKYLPTINFTSLILGLFCLIIVIGWRRFSSKIPGSLIAIFFSTLFVYLFDLPVETIGTKFGQISFSLFQLHLPHVSFPLFFELLSPAISIALLASMESLLSAVVADGMTEDKHCSSTELIALGLGNLVSMLFGGIPATAGFARTTANIKNGARTPFSAIFHSLFLLLIVIFFAKTMTYIPLCSLSALLMVVSYNMSEVHHFSRIFNSPKSDIFVLLTTFFLTVFVGLIFAVQAGVVLAVFLFTHHMVETLEGKFFKEKSPDDHKEDGWSSHLKEIPPEIEVFEIQGPFFFASVEKFKTALYRINHHPRVLILRFRHVTIVDATAIRALEDLLAYCKRQQIHLIFSGVKGRLNHLFRQKTFLQKIGEDHIFSNIDEALKEAKNHCPSLQKDESLLSENG